MIAHPHAMHHAAPRPVLRTTRTGAMALLAACGLASPAMAQSTSAAPDASPIAAPARPGPIELAVTIDKIHEMRINSLAGLDGPPIMTDRDGCTDVVTHSDANFGGGNFVLQAGFSTGEIAAQSYTVDPNDYPIRLDTMEMIFATFNATEVTTTQWSILIWDGDPIGQPDYEFSSDDLILPHLVLGPGTAGANIFVQVDPDDPEQIFLFNNGGSNTFTVGYRIDLHNAPSASPCTVAPNRFRNAFPTTDNLGLSEPTQNWLFGLNCGSFGCPPFGGWTTFADLNFFCRPSGDWNIRVNWTKVNCQPGVGACCKIDGSCDVMLVDDCAAVGGVYQGDGTTCATVVCPTPTGACCTTTGSCVGDVTEALCNSFGGAWAGGGTNCDDADQNGTADACEAAQCIADLTTSSDPSNPGFGVPDGIVDANDFFYFLDRFAAGDLAVADLTGSSDPNNPSYGVPDGVLDANDFFFYLAAFAAGC